MPVTDSFEIPLRHIQLEKLLMVLRFDGRHDTLCIRLEHSGDLLVFVMCFIRKVGFQNVTLPSVSSVSGSACRRPSMWTTLLHIQSFGSGQGIMLAHAIPWSLSYYVELTVHRELQWIANRSGRESIIMLTCVHQSHILVIETYIAIVLYWMLFGLHLLCTDLRSSDQHYTREAPDSDFAFTKAS